VPIESPLVVCYPTNIVDIESVTMTIFEMFAAKITYLDLGQFTRKSKVKAGGFNRQHMVDFLFDFY